MPEQKQKVDSETLTNLTSIEDLDDICPPWWPKLLWRLMYHSPGRAPAP
jgi:hypothetical protein